MAAATEAIDKVILHPQLTIPRKAEVASGVTIFKGTTASIDGSGDAIDGVTSARVAGIAVETYEAGETGTFNFNMVAKYIKSDAAATDVGDIMYLLDNQTVTATPNTAPLGPVVDFETGFVYVRLDLDVT